MDGIQTLVIVGWFSIKSDGSAAECTEAINSLLFYGTAPTSFLFIGLLISLNNSFRPVPFSL